MLTGSWHVVSGEPLNSSVTTHPQLHSRLGAETASGITDLAETTAEVAQTNAIAHFPLTQGTQ